MVTEYFEASLGMCGDSEIFLSTWKQSACHKNEINLGRDRECLGRTQ